MPRSKNTRPVQRQYFEKQNNVFENGQNYGCNKNLQSSENSNINLQWDQTCDRASSPFKTEADSISKPTKNNRTSFLLSQNYQTDFNLSHNCFANSQHVEISTADPIMTQNLQTQNSHKDTNELQKNSMDLQENQDFEPKNLLSSSTNGLREDDSKVCEDTSADSQQDQNNPSDVLLEKDLNIRTKTCDMDSKDAQDCHEHCQAESELHIKSEHCDIDSHSDPLMSENDKECKLRSENSNEASDREIDHSNNSSMEVDKSDNPESTNCTDSSPNQDLKRSRRNSKRRRETEDRCPVCGLTLRHADLENHFTKEIENLSNIPRTVRKYRAPYKEREGFTCGVNLAYAQTKCNREKRLAAKRAKYVKKQVVTCPVCKISISGTDEEINNHVLRCFGEDDDSDINVTDYDENFEEYEIGNETRIRAISLVPGGHSALHGCSSKSKSTNDEDDGVDVNVDVDDTLSFGKPQYTELDVIHNTSSSSNETEEQLRRAVVSDLNAEPHVIEGNKWSQNCDIQNDIDEIIGTCVKNKPEEMLSKEDEAKGMKVDNDSKKEENFQNAESCIISTLKERIKDLEQQKNVKCLICLEPYTTPLVSTTCWHVHCEECWLVSMGVKKLCPQCNMIVFPTDLRKIYL